MESLQQNTTYQILKLRLELYESKERERLIIKQYGYVEEAKKFRQVSMDINNKLDAIKQNLEEQYFSMELTSENIKELQEISSSLLEFKDFDETLLSKVESKIAELTTLKENTTINYDFTTARNAREEIHLLQEYFYQHRRYLSR